MTTENQSPTSVSDVSVSELSAQSGPSALELRAEEAMRGISEMIRLRMTRSPAISQMEEWMETINVLLAAALKGPPADARDAVTDEVAEIIRVLRESLWVVCTSGQWELVKEKLDRLAALTGKADGAHGHAAASDELAAKEVLVPCDCGCGRQCCAMCGNDLGFIAEATQPAAPYKLTDDDLEIV